ncbi:hypothetical protein PISMIDRAFT_673764, partial [Pisolithus microcarpus 441]
MDYVITTTTILLALPYDDAQLIHECQEYWMARLRVGFTTGGCREEGVQQQGDSPDQSTPSFGYNSR